MQEAVLLLLRYDCDVNIKNAEGLTAGDLAKNQNVRDLIEGDHTDGQAICSSAPVLKP